MMRQVQVNELFLQPNKRHIGALVEGLQRRDELYVSCCWQSIGKKKKFEIRTMSA